MSPTPAPYGRRGTLAVAAVGVTLAIGGTFAVVTGLPGDAAGPPQPIAARTPAPTPAATSAPAPPPAAPLDLAAPGAASVAPPGQDLDIQTMSRSRPVELTIPAIGVSSPTIVELGKEADGSLEVPEDYAQPGWFTEGPAPGQFGPAVIAGHVDSKSGPAVFYRLGELQPGAQISIRREDGSTAVFEVDKVERYRKDEFPTAAVYSDTTQRSELRLITCGGAFDTSTGHYVDNIVAYAHLV